MGVGFVVGGRVSARGLTWDVIEVVSLGAQTRLHLRCAGGDLGGLEWDILHPAEPSRRCALNSGRMRPGRCRHGGCIIRRACSIRCSGRAIGVRNPAACRSSLISLSR